VGSGAFMREEDRARALAHALVRTGNSCGIRTRALLTDMNQPLGRAVGNSLEVKECIELLRGEGDEGARPVMDLSLELSAHMLVLSHVDDSLDAARARLQKMVNSGAAMECFCKNVEAQGGDPRVCDEPAKILPLTENSFKVESPRPGFVIKVDTEEIGNAIAEAGGGRVRIEDQIDPSVGFIADVKIGDRVQPGDPIGTVFSADVERGQRAATRISAAYEIGDEHPPELLSLIKEVIE